MNVFHKILQKIAHFQVERPFFVLLILIAATLAMFGGVSRVQTVASLEKMMPPDIEEISAFNTLRDNYLGQDIIAVVISIDRESSLEDGVFDIRDKRVYDYLTNLESAIGETPDVIQIYGFHQFLSPHISKETTDEEYVDILNKVDVSQFVNTDASTTMLLITSDVAADDVRMKALANKIRKDVESMGYPAGVNVELTGTPIIQQRLGELIAHDRASTQWISTLLVFILTMITFGTFTSALVPIIVVTMSVNWLYGTMGYNNLPISTLAGGVAAMVIGIGIDFAIHIMNKFKYERKKGLSIKKSIELAVVQTGTALTATSLTTISAFLAFLSGQMPEMGRFGLLMAIGIAYSLFFSLIGLPAILVLEEKFLYWFKNKAHFGVEGEFHLATDKETCPPKKKGDVRV